MAIKHTKESVKGPEEGGNLEIRSQKTEVRSQKTEVRSQKMLMPEPVSWVGDGKGFFPVAAIGAAAPGGGSRCTAGGARRPKEARAALQRNTACGAGTIADSATATQKIILFLLFAQTAISIFAVYLFMGFVI